MRNEDLEVTTWPLRRGQAIDVWFNQSQDAKDGLFSAGYYRGTIDKVTAPSATGIQTATIDFPDDFTTTKIDLTKSQLYTPGTQPEKPSEMHACSSPHTIDIFTTPRAM